jgi:hypothetical protein
MGLPTSSILVFVFGMGPIGFWTGQVVANSFNAVFLTLLVFCVKWDKAATIQSFYLDKTRRASVMLRNSERKAMFRNEEIIAEKNMNF